MLYKSAIAFIGFFATLSQVAMASSAADCSGPDCDPFRVPPVTAKDLNDLRAACENPAAYHFQCKPTDIRLLCSGTWTEWDYEQSAIPVPVFTSLRAKLTSSKVVMCEEEPPICESTQSVPCLIYKEYQTSYAFEQSLTCTDILSSSATTVEQLCRGFAPPPGSLTPRTPTGRVVDLCPDIAK